MGELPDSHLKVGGAAVFPGAHCHNRCDTGTWVHVTRVHGYM